jgi:hypothetical protein
MAVSTAIRTDTGMKDPGGRPMKKIAMTTVLVLCVAQYGMGQMQTVKKQPAPQQQAAPERKVVAEQVPAQAQNQKPDPQQQAALERKMAAEHAAGAQAPAQAQARVRAKLAQAQLDLVNRSKQLLSSLSQQVTPAAQPAVQARLAQLQEVNDALVRTQSPIALETIWPRFKPISLRPNPPGCPATPAISSLSVSSGQPGDPVWIHGNGFGAESTVTFLVGNGNKQTASIDYANCTEMIVSVPQVTGVEAYAGAVIVSNSPSQTAATPFQFEPTIDTQVLPIGNNNVTWADVNCPGNGYLGSSVFSAYEGDCMTEGGLGYQSYSGGLFAGGKDDDNYFTGYQLKNGWVLDSVDLTSQNGSFTGSAGARVEGANIGSASPHVTAHSYVDADDLEGYVLTIYIHGPAGVPYQ